MATADARDILGIANDGPRVPAPKSKKKALVEHGPRLKGMQREARALQGDSVPPVTLTEGPDTKSGQIFHDYLRDTGSSDRLFTALV